MDPAKNMTNQTSALNDEQIAKIEDTLQRLVIFSKNNSAAIVLLRNMKMSKDFNEKRKWVTMIYAQLFQTLSMINMAISNADTLQEYSSKLDDLFKAQNGPKSK